MKYITTLLVFILLTSCSSTVTQENKIINETNTQIESQEITIIQTEEFDEKDIDLDLKNSDIVYVELDSEDTTTTDDTTIQISGQDITIKKSGNYEFSGELTDGQIIVETEDEKNVQIILNDVEITNNDGPTIFIKSTSQAIITLADGSDNKLEDGDSYNESEDGENANIYSKEDLVIMGEGSLEVVGNYNDGIVSKDKLYITSGDIEIKATDDGIRGKDYLLIEGGDIDIEAEGDAIKSDNEEEATIYITGGDIIISAGDDAIHSELYVVIDDGDISVEDSYEGIEAQYITINGGDIYVESNDDAINASSGSDTDSGEMFKGGGNSDDGSIVYFNGGDVILNASGDGFDSNGQIIMTDGKITVFGPEQNNNGSLDYNGTFEISGGEVIAIGSSGMVQTPGESEYVNTISIGLSESYGSGEDIVIKDSSGDKVLDIESIKTFQSIVFSSSELKTGEDYTYYIGGEEIGEFTITDAITTIGEFQSNDRGTRGMR